MTDRPSPPYWAESPAGIVTLDGGRYHTTEADLRAFAPQVIDRYGMDALLEMASTWHRLPTTKGLLILVALLPYVAIWQAVAASLVVWLFASVVSPSTVFLAVMKPVKWLSHPVVQGLIYVLILSILAASGRLGAMAVGLAGFILFRWQILERVASRLVDALRTPLSPLPAQDAILRNIIVRAALRHGYSVGGTDAMQRRILEIMNYRRRSRK
jgi:hypothetical protein